MMKRKKKNYHDRERENIIVAGQKEGTIGERKKKEQT